MNYNWQNIASYSVATGGGSSVTFYIDAKLSSQSGSGNYSVVDTRLNSTKQGNYVGGSGYGFGLTGSAGVYGAGVWNYENETICTGQVTIGHDAYGNMSSIIYASAYNNYLGFNINFSGDIILPRIAKAPFVSELTTSGLSYNSVSASFTITDNGGSAVTSTSLSIYSDSGLTQLVETKSGTSATFTNLHPNKNYWIVGRATNGAGTRATNTKQVNTEGSVVRLRMSGGWKEAIPYVRVNGVWKEVMPYIRSNGQWKEGI